MKKLLLTALVGIFTFVLVACGGSNNSELVGSWERESTWDGRIIVWEFFDDNSGTWNMGDGIPDVFEWSIRNNVITMEFTEFNESEEYEFRIEGNNLIMIEDGNEFVYIRR